MANLSEEVQRGHAARGWLENPIYKEAVERVRAVIVERWQDAPIRDKEGQHELKVMLHVLDQVVKHVETVAQTGDLAAKQLEAQLEQERRLKRMKRFVGL